MKHITILVATIGKNLELAHKFKETLIDEETSVSILNVVDLDLPLYASIHESKFVAMDLIGDKLQELKESSGLVFLVPEYNGGIPPALTNFIAWISRASKDWRECFNGKSCAIGTYSAGGGSNVLTLLRLQLSYMGMNVIGRQVATNMLKPADDQGVASVCGILKKSITLP